MRVFIGIILILLSSCTSPICEVKFNKVDCVFSGGIEEWSHE